MASRSDLLPTDESTERFLIGSVLLEPKLMDVTRAALESDDFASQRHRDVWTACCAVYDAGGVVAPITVFLRLQEIGKHEQAPPSYLSGLMEGIPIFGSLDREIEKLKAHTLYRRMMALCSNISQACAARAEDANDLHSRLISAAQDLVSRDSDRSAISTRDLVDKYGIQELLMPSRQRTGLRMPWPRLQGAIGGMRGGQMIVVAAYTSRGKSSFACQVATHCTRQDTGVFYWTTEMSAEALFRRMVDQMSGIDGMRHREACLTDEEINRAKGAVTWLYDNPVWFDRSSRSVPAMLASLRQVRQKHKIGLVVVDHLQHVKSSSRSYSRAQEVSEISRSLKMASLDFDLPVMVVSQVSRPKEDNMPLTIHALKESGDIENDADAILLLNSPKPSGLSPVSVAVNVAKQREGAAGFDIPLLFRPSTQAFESLEDA